jgi:cytochrome c-type biogenesis protein
MVLQTSDISIPIAYFAGFLMFFAPCLLPIVPAYISYIAGLSFQDVLQASGEQSRANRWRLLAASTSFVAGFLAVFMLFGLTASYLGAQLVSYRQIMHVVGGVLLIIVGAYIAGFFELSLFGNKGGLRVSKQLTRFTWLNAFIIGVSFGFSWTPCIGPVLAVILFWASQADSFARGALLLFFYSLGVGTPLILLSLFIQRGTLFLKNHAQALRAFTKVSGVIIMVMGILLIGNWLFSWSALFAPLGSLELFFDVK